MSTSTENALFAQNGFEIQNMEGTFFHAITTKTDYPVYVTIEKQDKNHASCKDNLNKEQEILNYLTNSQTRTNEFVNTFTVCFESDEYFYSVAESKPLTLKQFITHSFEYIRAGKLKRKEYNKVIKAIFFQLSVGINWLHNDMNCSGLNLAADNIYLHNLEFIIDSTTGSTCISPDFIVKLAHVSQAEIFEKDNNDKSKYESIDMWEMGMIMYESIIGSSITSLDKDAYNAIMKNKLIVHLKMTALIKYFNSKTLKVITKLLQPEENKRLTAKDLVCCKWFAKLYKKVSTN